MIKNFITIVSFFAFNLACAVEAQVSSSPSIPPRVVQSPISISSISQMMVALLFVLALIVIIAWLLKRSGRLSGLNKGRIKIIEAASLGTREKAVLMDVDNKKILVGVSAGRVNTLHVFEENDKSFDEHLKSLPTGQGE